MKVTNMVKQIPMKHLAFFSLLCSSAASAAERPNIIYIFTDQQTASAMSCAGNPDLHTPNLDRLAAAGVMGRRRMGAVVHKRYGIEVCAATLQRVMSRPCLTVRIRQVCKAKPCAGKATRQ